MDEIPYEQLGVNFVTHVLTPERVAATVSHVAGDEVRVGPMGAGPGGAAQVTATGAIGEITAQIVWSEAPLAFEATIPVDLDLNVRVAGASHRYRGRLTVPLRIRVRAYAPVTLVFDIAPISANDVRVELSADGMRAKLLQRLGNVDDEVRRNVAEAVNQRLNTEEAQAVRSLDVVDYVNRTWAPGG